MDHHHQAHYQARHPAHNADATTTAVIEDPVSTTTSGRGGRLREHDTTTERRAGTNKRRGVWDGDGTLVESGRLVSSRV